MTKPIHHDTLWNSPVAKAGFLLSLVALLTIPKFALEALVKERSKRSQEVESVLSAQLGGSVSLVGPFLMLRDARTNSWTALSPETSNAEGTLQVSERYRGIYRVSLFRGKLNVQSVQGRAAPHGQHYDWHSARWAVYAPKKEAGQIQFEGNAEFATRETMDQGVVLSIPATPNDQGRYALDGRITWSGTQQFALAVPRIQGELKLGSNWPHPKFDGVFPTEETIRSDGFAAQWASPRPTDAMDLNTFVAHHRMRHATQLTFLEPSQHYLMVLRTVKYGPWMIALCFGCLFLMEFIRRISIPTLAYALIGAALTLFYLLLLSQAEHLRFLWAYTVASVAVVAMVVGYLSSILGRLRPALAFGGALVGYYVLVYFVLVEGQFALLMGSWALFALIAAVMYFARGVSRARTLSEGGVA